MSDEWTGQQWVIKNAVGDDQTLALKSVIMVANGNNTFELVAFQHSHQTVGYTFKPAGNDPNNIAAYWLTCKLFRRGTNPVTVEQYPAPSPLPLDPYTPESAPNHEKVADDIRGDNEDTVSAARLEGDIIVNGVAESVKFFQLPNAIRGGKSLLVIVVKSDQLGGPGLNEDGIGHGNN
jgi:hypothetical protein